MRIDFKETPPSEVIDFLRKKVNEATPDFGKMQPYGFFIRNDVGEILAGCNGTAIYGAIHISQLWVHPDKRKQGIGKQLLEQVHAYGRQQGCRFAVVSTMSFQGARGFYEKLGYSVDFCRTGYANASSVYILRKQL